MRERCYGVEKIFSSFPRIVVTVFNDIVVSEAYLVLYQTSMEELFVKPFFAKGFIIDV